MKQVIFFPPDYTHRQPAILELPDAVAGALVTAGVAAYPLVLTPFSTPAPAVTALPSGIVALWDAASLSTLADGASVTSWTDAVASVVTSGSGTPATFVKNSAGYPAVRTTGAGILQTSGTNVASTAASSAERTVLVGMRNVKDGGGNPCVASLSNGANFLLQANASSTGTYGHFGMFPCADPVRTVGMCSSTAKGLSLVCINGTALAAGDFGASGQVCIGGWTDGVSTGRADILKVAVWDRALSAAEFKQAHRHFCELLGVTRPAGLNVCMPGDSLTQGAGVAITDSWPYKLAQGLGLPWGTWDQMGAAGFTWFDMRDRTLPLIGNVSGATGRKAILLGFEYANMDTTAGAQIAQAAQSFVNAAHGLDPNLSILLGTATDEGRAQGVSNRKNRRDYIAALVAGLSGVDGLVRLDLDPNIGVEGCAPTDGNANTFFQSDGLHMLPPGYGLIDSGPYGFRAAVQARLAA